MLKKLNRSVALFFILGILIYSKVILGKNPGDDSLLNIQGIPYFLGDSYAENFDRYTKVVAPNGKAIHIVAQSDITNEQIVRCRSVLEHYLRDLPSSKYGRDKSEVANKMAENNAILLLLNGRDDGSNFVEVEGQPLYEDEIQVEGGSWYIDQDYAEHRDATFEEILHLVHDYGIGVDGYDIFYGALPEYQDEVRKAQKNALSNKIWGGSERGWIVELTKENSLSQEYLASLIDAYYGLWGAWKSSKSMWGIYTPKTREEIAIKDPEGKKLLEEGFFHPYLTYNARIHKEFKGTFSLCFDPLIPYTNHSRYLKDVTLLGKNNTDVEVNELANNITGNQGLNTVIFKGESREYTIRSLEDRVVVEDSVEGRDGVNTLKNIERLRFSDKTVEIR